MTIEDLLPRARTERGMPVRKLAPIRPCLPRPAKEPPAGPGWIHEIKHDGFRIMARRDAKGRSAIARRLAKDFEATIDSARAFLYAASVMLLVRRIAAAS